jgi:predicted tellurium resistance membrane protein TerC
MEHLFTADNLISLIVLIVLEVVLGIDNVIFVSIILNRLPEGLRKRGRWIWMFTGIGVRSILLFALQWLLQQKGKPVLTIWDKGFDLASLVMIGGGIFLIYKTVMEIHHKLEGEEEHAQSKKSQLTLGKAVVQIILIDMVFSFDSIITAGGTAKVLSVMIIAVVFAMIVMFLFSGKIAGFIQKHPTIKMLALSFLVMIGFILLVEGFNSEKAEELHLKNYAYFAMAFSFLVELLNMKLRKKTTPVILKDSDTGEEEPNK